MSEERMLGENERVKSEGKERTLFCLPEQPNNDGFV